MAEVPLVITPKLNRETIEWESQRARVAIQRAGSSALRAAQAEAVRQVQQRRAIRAKNIRDAISAIYPSSADTEMGMYRWYLRVSSKPLPVAAYPYRQSSSGIRAQIRAGAYSLIRHAFEATMSSGHTGIFVRFGPYRTASRGASKGKKRQAIKELYTTKVLDVFRDEGFIDAVSARAKAVFRSTFDRNYFGRSG